MFTCATFGCIIEVKKQVADETEDSSDDSSSSGTDSSDSEDEAQKKATGMFPW